MEGAEIRGHASAADVLAEAAEAGVCSDVYPPDGTAYIAVVSDMERVDRSLATIVPMDVFSGTAHSIMSVVCILLGAAVAIVAVVVFLPERQRRQNADLAYAERRTKDPETIGEQHERRTSRKRRRQSSRSCNVESKSCALRMWGAQHVSSQCVNIGIS